MNYQVVLKKNVFGIFLYHTSVLLSFLFNVSFKINKGRCVVGQKKKGEHSQGIFRGKC